MPLSESCICNCIRLYSRGVNANVPMTPVNARVAVLTLSEMPRMSHHRLQHMNSDVPRSRARWSKMDVEGFEPSTSCKSDGCKACALPLCQTPLSILVTYLFECLLARSSRGRTTAGGVGLIGAANGLSISVPVNRRRVRAQLPHAQAEPVAFCTVPRGGTSLGLVGWMRISMDT